MTFKKDIIRISVTLFAVFIVFLLLDSVIGYVFDSLLDKMPEEGERFAKSHYVIKRAKSDIVIIGSSRALAHYDPTVFNDYYPSHSVFNCGVDGQLFYYADIAANCILNRYVPRTLIWDFQINDLEIAPTENLSLLYPYYKSDSYVKQRLDELDHTLKYKIWINVYRYNGTAGRLLSTLRMPKTLNRQGFGGHTITDGTRKFRKRVSHVTDGKLDSDKVNCLINTITRLREKKVNVIFVISPMFNVLNGESSTVASLKQICSSNGIPFINDSQLPEFVGKEELFYDEGHLNNKGARIYTGILIKQIENE